MSSKRKDIKTELVCGIFNMCANASIDGLKIHMSTGGELKTFSLQIIFIAIQLTQNLKNPLHLFEYKEYYEK